MWGTFHPSISSLTNPVHTARQLWEQYENALRIHRSKCVSIPIHMRIPPGPQKPNTSLIPNYSNLSPAEKAQIQRIFSP